MATVTLSRPDVSFEDIADTLRHRLSTRFQVRTDGGPEADRFTVGRGSARVFRARVTIARQGDQTILHLHAGGLTLPLQLINRLWIVPKVAAALRAVPGRR